MLPGFDVLQVFFRHCRLLIINTHQELKVTVSLKITLMLQRLVKRMSGVSVSATRPPSEREGSQRYMHVQLITCDDVMSLVCSHNLHHVKQIVTDLGFVFYETQTVEGAKAHKTPISTECCFVSLGACSYRLEGCFQFSVFDSVFQCAPGKYSLKRKPTQKRFRGLVFTCLVVISGNVSRDILHRGKKKWPILVY